MALGWLQHSLSSTSAAPADSKADSAKTENHDGSGTQLCQLNHNKPEGELHMGTTESWGRKSWCLEWPPPTTTGQYLSHVLPRTWWLKEKTENSDQHCFSVNYDIANKFYVLCCRTQSNSLSLHITLGFNCYTGRSFPLAAFTSLHNIKPKQ